MKIALIGPGSTGKTTLCDMYSMKHSIGMIPEYIREVAVKQKIKDIGKLSLQEIWKLQEEIYQRKTVKESQYKSFIADRAVLDGAAYSAISYLKEGEVGLDFYYDYFYPKYVEYTKKNYDLLIFVKRTFKFEDDGFRLNHHIEDIAELILLGILNKESIKYIIFDATGSPKERLQALEKLIDANKK